MTGVLHDKNGGRRSFPGDKLAVLRKHPIFCDLDAEAFDQLCRYAKHSTLKRGTTIVSKGDPGNSLIAVISGTVKISVSSPDGRSAISTSVAPERSSYIKYTVFCMYEKNSRFSMTRPSSS